jgi:hypothetical protein
MMETVMAVYLKRLEKKRLEMMQMQVSAVQVQSYPCWEHYLRLL